MTDISPLEQMLLGNLSWNKTCVKFLARLPVELNRKWFLRDSTQPIISYV
jgi:hypothetical protein